MESADIAIHSTSSPKTAMVRANDELPSAVTSPISNSLSSEDAAMSSTQSRIEEANQMFDGVVSFIFEVIAL